MWNETKRQPDSRQMYKSLVYTLKTVEALDNVPYMAFPGVVKAVLGCNTRPSAVRERDIVRIIYSLNSVRTHN